MEKPEKTPIVYLTRASKDFSYWWDLIFLGRTQHFKNNPRAYWFALQAIACSFWIGMFTFLLAFCANQILPYLLEHSGFNFSTTNGIPVDQLAFKTAAAFTVTSSLIYWRLTAVFRDQWQYFAEFYNQIKASEHRSQIEQKRFNDLALDLLVTDMWGHPSFQVFFTAQVKEAFQELNTLLDNPLDTLEKSMKSNRISEDQAKVLLEGYDSILIEKIKLRAEVETAKKHLPIETPIKPQNKQKIAEIAGVVLSSLIKAKFGI